MTTEAVADAPARMNAWRRLRNTLSVLAGSKAALIGLTIVFVWVAIAVSAPLITGYSPLEQDYLHINEGPSGEHVLGTDHMGRDVWSRLAFGARTILVLAPLSVAASFVLGMLLGLPSGYFGGWIDESIMRLLDAIMAFPIILLLHDHHFRHRGLGQ